MKSQRPSYTQRSYMELMAQGNWIEWIYDGPGLGFFWMHFQNTPHTHRLSLVPANTVAALRRKGWITANHRGPIQLTPKGQEALIERNQTHA